MSFIENTLSKFYAQLSNAAQKVNKYVTTLGLPTTTEPSLKADAAFVGWVVLTKQQFADYAHSWVEFGDDLFHGNPLAPALVPPPLPVITTAPTATLPGAYSRFSDFAALCKLSPNYTDAIGKDLGIVEISPAFNPQDGKPKLAIDLHVGYPYLHYKKGHYHGASVYKDSGKGFVRIDKTLLAHYTDETPLPPANAPEIWTYKIVYLYQNKEVGTESDPVSVTVKGI